MPATCPATIDLQAPTVEISMEETFHVETERVDLRVIIADPGPLNPKTAEAAIRTWARTRVPGATISFTTAEDI